MASPSDDKPSPPPQQSPPPPPPPDLFDCIRRFTDHHIASALHNLIGVPTMLPPSKAWIMDEEDAPHPVATAPTPEAPAKTTEPESTPSPSQPTRGRMSECSLLSDPRASIFRPEEEQRLIQVWRQMSALQRDFAAPFFTGDVWGTGKGKGWDTLGVKPLYWSVGMIGDGKRVSGLRTGEDGKSEREEFPEKEMDAYSIIASPNTSRTFMSTTSSFESQDQNENPGKPGVVATVATTHSYTSPDGVTRTTYVLKKRFADGSEECVKEDKTSVADGGVKGVGMKD